MDRVLRAAAWACLITLAVLAETPKGVVVRPGWGAHVEHVVAYAGTGLVTVLAYGREGRGGRIILALLAYAAALEALQAFVPGRQSGLSDFLASGTGIVVGCTAGLVLASRPWILAWRKVVKR